jgi:glycosyltransferase involved in cell wall biosynthesis
MKVSVIVPVYNQAPFLAECLDSVLAQTLRDIEVVCIDDGSTDGSGRMLDEYAARDPRVKVVHQTNAGPGPARNAGMDVAQGDFIAFMDPDDKYPDVGVLADLVRGAESNGVDVCGGSMVMIDGRRLDDAEFSFQSDGIIDYSEYQFEYGYVRFIFRRRLLQSYGASFPSLKRFQDVPFFVEAMHAAGKFCALKRDVYSLRPHGDSIDWAANECAKGRDNAIGLSVTYGMAVRYGYGRMAERLLSRMSEFVGSLGWDIRRLRSEVARLEGIVADRERTIAEITESKAYRTGLVLAWPVRRLRDAMGGRR